MIGSAWDPFFLGAIMPTVCMHDLIVGSELSEVKMLVHRPGWLCICPGMFLVMHHTSHSAREGSLSTKGRRVDTAAEAWKHVSPLIVWPIK